MYRIKLGISKDKGFMYRLLTKFLYANEMVYKFEEEIYFLKINN